MATCHHYVNIALVIQQNKKLLILSDHERILDKYLKSVPLDFFIFIITSADKMSAVKSTTGTVCETTALIQMSFYLLGFSME